MKIQRYQKLTSKSPSSCKTLADRRARLITPELVVVVLAVGRERQCWCGGWGSIVSLIALTWSPQLMVSTWCKVDPGLMRIRTRSLYTSIRQQQYLVCLGWERFSHTNQWIFNPECQLYVVGDTITSYSSCWVAVSQLLVSCQVAVSKQLASSC